MVLCGLLVAAISTADPANIVYRRPTMMSDYARVRSKYTPQACTTGPPKYEDTRFDRRPKRIAVQSEATVKRFVTG